MASPHIDPAKTKYWPEMLIEAINQSSISISGESIASYQLDDRNVVIEDAETVTQTANMDLVISTDGSEKARIRSDAFTLRDRLRVGKIRARSQVDFSGIMTAGGPTTNTRHRWCMTIRKPTIVDKLRDGFPLSDSERSIADELHLEENLMLGTIPYNQSLLTADFNKMFDDIIYVEREQAIIAAGATGIIGGSEVYVPSANQQVIVLLGVMVDTAMLGAGTADDTYLVVDRDNDPEYMKLDITAMPDATYLRCFVPALRKLKVYISSTTGTSAESVGFVYGVRDINFADRIRWNLPPASPTARLEFENIIQKYPKAYRSIMAGVQ